MPDPDIASPYWDRGWLISETVKGNFLEYWADGKCMFSFSTDTNMNILQQLKLLLNGAKVKPV